MASALDGTALSALFPITELVDARWLGLALIAVLLVGFVRAVFKSTQDKQNK